eukprot:351317-Chlamydomonas_euryale.AAC.6
MLSSPEVPASDRAAKTRAYCNLSRLRPCGRIAQSRPHPICSPHGPFSSQILSRPSPSPPRVRTVQHPLVLLPCLGEEVVRQEGRDGAAHVAGL